MAEIPEELLGLNTDAARKCARLCILLCAAVAAYFLADDLDIVEAITGGALTLSTSLVFPTMFHLALFRHELPRLQCAAETALVVLAVVCGVALTTGDVLELLSR